MEAENLARQVAAELAGEFGSNLKNKTEEAIRGESQLTRNLDLGTAANVAVIAHFIVAVAPAVLAKWTTHKDKAAVTAEVSKSVDKPAELKQAIADQVITAAVNKAAEQN